MFGNPLDKAKKRLRKHYLDYLAIADEYSCGLTLAEHISPRLSEAKRLCNIWIDEINKLDHTANLKHL